MTPYQIRQLARKFEPRLREAFIEIMETHKLRLSMPEIERAYAADNVEELVEMLVPGAAAMLPFEEQSRQAYIAAGVASLASVPPPPSAGLDMSFSARNYRSEQYLREASSEKVTEILDEQRVAVREALADGKQRGVGPRTAALELAGRVGEGGRRVGGVVGLTSGQAEYVENARRELSDPATMRKFLRRKRRDRRFDPMIRKAIKAGKPLGVTDVERIVGRYSDRLLQLRAETIARTETLQSLNTGNYNAMLQLIEEHNLRPEQVRKVWRTASDGRVRDSHAYLNGDSVGLNERFGNGLLYAQEIGAPADQVINCRCVTETRVDWLSNG